MMRTRWLVPLACVFLGLLMVFDGLGIPVYLRAVDARVIQQAGRNTPTLVTQADALANEQRLGVAELLLQAAQSEKVAGREQLAQTVNALARQHPDWVAWGDDTRVARLFADQPASPAAGLQDFTDLMVVEQNRESALQFLNASPKPAVQELLRCRGLTRTVRFDPSSSASGQAFDVAVSVCGLLLEGGRLTPSLSGSVQSLAATANRGGNSEPLEEVLMDFLSLGRRFNWDQLTAFVSRIQDTTTLHQMADEARNAGGSLAVLFAAVQLSDNPAGVSKYLMSFNQTGFQDLGASLSSGTGGVSALLQSGHRLYFGGFARRTTANAERASTGPPVLWAGFCAESPRAAMALKWFLYALAGYLFATALHFARPAVSLLERPLQVRGFHVFREILFALGFLLLVLIVSEPFLAQESQKGDFSFRLSLPMAGGAVPAGIAGVKQVVMNPIVLLTMLVFFVLQALIYTACLVKLAEIRRQNVPPRMKLKLLENEEHLFDAGLYLGFVGTIVSLIIASLHFVQFSLMAAYSSTSFGIIFVVIFKIFHLRPVRRKLLLEAEAEANSAETRRTAAAPAPAAA